MCVGVPQILLYWLFFAFALFPLSLSPPPLSLLCCVCLFFYTDWCIFRSVLTRLEPCGFGFGLGPLLFGSQCGFLPLAHAKQKGGTRKLSFAGGRKSNGTRATLAQRSAWKGVNKCAGNSSGNVFYFLFLFSALLCFNETERNFSASRFDFDWISKYILSLSLSLSLFFENNIKLCPLLEK